MKYNQYITKKRIKTDTAICGDINLPYGTICDVDGEFICYNGNIICAITSQNGIDYFWGYDSNNPEEEIERQKLSKKLDTLAPKDYFEDKNNPWNNYGYFSEDMRGMLWNWKESTLDLPKSRLEYLIECVKKGVTPFV